MIREECLERMNSKGILGKALNIDHMVGQFKQHWGREDVVDIELEEIDKRR
jgi:hypothetical protein